MPFQSLFSGENKKNIINLTSAEIAQGVVKAKHDNKFIITVTEDLDWDSVLLFSLFDNIVFFFHFHISIMISFFGYYCKLTSCSVIKCLTFFFFLFYICVYHRPRSNASETISAFF